MKEYIKINAEGNPIDNKLFSEDDAIPAGYVLSWQYQEEKTWWEPIYDRENKVWVEGLSREKIAQRLCENEKEKNKATDVEMNAIAILELSKFLLGGGE